MDEARYREAERRLWEWVGVTPTERQVHLKRNDVTVRVQEVGDGPAVLFVHGGSNGGASWATLVSRLEGFHCVALDRPGCGLSDPLDSVGVDGLPTFGDTLVVDVLDALGLESAHLVSTSFGGYFALRGAAAYPDRIGRMVHFGWSAGAPPARLPALMRLASVRSLGRLLAASLANERAVRSMLRQIGLGQALDAGRFSREMLDWYVALLRYTDTMRNELRLATPAVVERLVLPDSVLGRIRTPISFLWGEEDPFAGADIAAQFVGRILNAELALLPHAGHAVWLDDLDLAASVTTGFLGD